MEHPFKMVTEDGGIEIGVEGKEICVSIYNFSPHDYSFANLGVEEAELLINVIQDFVNVIKGEEQSDE